MGFPVYVLASRFTSGLQACKLRMSHGELLGRLQHPSVSVPTRSGTGAHGGRIITSKTRNGWITGRAVVLYVTHANNSHERGIFNGRKDGEIPHVRVVPMKKC